MSELRPNLIGPVMTFGRFFSIILTTSLLGCSDIVPKYDVPYDEFGTPRVGSIIERIQCELAVMADKDYKNSGPLTAGDFVAVFQLDLTVNDTGGLAPSFTYIASPMFSFGAGVKYERSREQNFTEKLIFSLRDMQKRIEDGKKTGTHPYMCPKEVETNLSGDLGLRQTVEAALLSPGLNIGTKLNGNDGAFGGYINFVVTKNFNSVGPTWTLRHFRGPGELGSLSEVNTDRLTFAFAQGNNAGKADRLVDQISQTNVINALRSLRAQ